MDNELLQLNETINKDIADKKAATQTATVTDATVASTTATTEVPSTVDWGKVSDDELKKILAERKITTTAEAPKVKTPDEIERENEARELSIIKYGVEKLGKKKEELLRPSELKNKKTEDLVWDESETFTQESFEINEEALIYRKSNVRKNLETLLQIFL